MNFSYNKDVSFVTSLEYDECVRILKENLKRRLLAGSVRGNLFWLICYRRNPVKPSLIAGLPTYFYGKLIKEGGKTKIEGVYKTPFYLKLTILVTSVFTPFQSVFQKCKCYSAPNYVPSYCIGGIKTYAFILTSCIILFLLSELSLWFGRRDIDITTEFLRDILKAEK